MQRLLIALIFLITAHSYVVPSEKKALRTQIVHTQRKIKNERRKFEKLTHVLNAYQKTYEEEQKKVIQLLDEAFPTTKSRQPYT